MATVSVSNGFLLVFGLLALVSLVPVIWAIVDVVRRPAWQFSTGRKVMWAITLGVGWLILWPIALISSLLYLTVLRRRFPPRTLGPGIPTAAEGPWRPTAPQVHPRDLPPAAWYPDPAGGPGERWWDGLGWSGRTR